MSLDTVSVLDRGGISTESGPGTSPLLAKRYSNPALGERVVVRLVQDDLATVDDLSLAVYGFAPVGAVPVGYERTRAVGFPAWPIIHDPANARHALNLVGDLQRASGLARHSAGKAQVLINDLAAHLGESAPHFLPTFLEEAARIFFDNDNRTFATQYFGKAREAERIHHLAIDEERHREAMLEFALRGALSAKELTNESKALLERTTPDEALRLFHGLLVDRVRGGLPPYANQATDVRRLAKAAGVKPLVVEQDFLRDTLSAPSLAKAPAGFWKAYLPALKALATDDPEVRAGLTRFVAEAIPSDDWVDLLEDVGVAADLRAGTVDAAAWVQRYVSMLQSAWRPAYPQKLAQLLRECPSLKGTTLELSALFRRVDLELLDAVLSVGAHVSYPQPPSGVEPSRQVHHWINDWLTDWVNAGHPDLPYLCADPDLKWLVEASFSECDEQAVEAVLDSPAVRSLYGEWVETTLPDHPTFRQAMLEVYRLRHVINPEGLALFGPQLERFRELINGPRLLTDGLQQGLLTELAWPTLEEAAVAVLAEGRPARPGDPAPRVRLHEAWPAIGVSYDGHVKFVDGDQVVASASFAPQGATDPRIWEYTLVEGVIGCHYAVEYEGGVVWSHEPSRLTPVESRPWGRGGVSASIPVPGGRLCDETVVRPGSDTPAWSGGGNVLHDGQNYWTVAMNDSYEWETVTIDPSTGKTGRASVPSRLADLVEPSLRDGYTLIPMYATLRPVTPNTAGSLMSTLDGWHQAALLREGVSSRFVDADGTVLDGERGVDVGGRIRRPGGGHWLMDDGVLYLTPNTSDRLENACDERGLSHLLHAVPPIGWHQFGVRDAEASARLRAMTAEQCAELYDCAPIAADVAAGVGPEEDLITDESRAVAERLLGTTDRALTDAVIWLAARIKLVVTAIAGDFADTDADDEAGTFTQWEPDADAIAWVRVAKRDRDDLLIAGKWLQGAGQVPTSSTQAWAIVGTMPEVLLACAAAPLQPEGVIQGAAALFGAAVDAGWGGPDTTWFLATPEKHDSSVAYAVGDQRVLQVGYQDVDYDLDRMRFNYLTRGEAPQSLDGAPTDVVAAGRGSVEQVKAAFTQLLESGPPPWDPTWVTRLATGTGWSRAAAGVFLTGLRDLSSYNRNFLPREVRTMLGLKVAEAAEARDFLRAVDELVLLRMMAAGAADPLRVVSEGPDIDAMVDLWFEYADDEIVIPDHLRAGLTRFSRGAMVVVDSLRAGEPLVVNQPSAAHNGVTGLLWLTANLEGSDPLRSWVADAFETLRAGIAAGSQRWTYLDPSVRTALGLPGAKDEQRDTTSVGAWTVQQIHNQYDELLWAPGQVVDWQQESQFLQLLPEDVRDSARYTAVVADQTLHQLIDDLRVPMGGWPQDPFVSAGAVVVEVVDRMGLDESSARYWLQLLALPNPTDKLVDTWNGWGKAHREAAVKPLLEKSLVMEAKRARAGRSYFLPGGWQEATAPHLPLEVWKAPLVALNDSRKVDPTFGIVTPLVPYGQLFADAWARYTSGDVPGYVELRTQRYRRS